MIAEFIVDDVGPPLDQLLPQAARALALENARLQGAFDLSPRPTSDDRSGQLNRSLAYWVFETTLAYEIFKGWLPLADVDWEVSYPSNAGQKADLVVYERSQPVIVIECKWWMRSDALTVNSLAADVSKLLTWPGEQVRRVLLTFWHSPDGHHQRDWNDVLRFCGTVGCSPVWRARFPIHHHASAHHHFALAALQLQIAHMVDHVPDSLRSALPADEHSNHLELLIKSWKPAPRLVFSPPSVRRCGRCGGWE